MKQAFYATRWICKVYKATAPWTIKSTIWTIIKTPSRIIINGFGPFITHPTDKIKFFSLHMTPVDCVQLLLFSFQLERCNELVFPVQSEREKCGRNHQECINSSSYFFSFLFLHWTGGEILGEIMRLSYFFWIFFFSVGKYELTTAISRTLYEMNLCLLVYSHTNTSGDRLSSFLVEWRLGFPT